MAKSHGGNRALTPGSKKYNNRHTEFGNKLLTGKYSDGFFSEKSGGYYLIGKVIPDILKMKSKLLSYLQIRVIL